MKLRSAPLDEVYNQLDFVLRADGGSVAMILLRLCRRIYGLFRSLMLAILRRRWRDGGDQLSPWLGGNRPAPKQTPPNAAIEAGSRGLFEGGKVRREDSARHAMAVPRNAQRACRQDGGLSTGAKTAEGIERIRQAVTKHGFYSAAAKAERLYLRDLLRESRALLGKVFESV